MTHPPFGYTLLGASTACCTFWTVALNQIEYVGTLAFMGLQLCLACWLIIGVVKLINRVRQAFTFGSRDLADFVSGKSAPLIKAQPRTPTGQFASKREVIHAALRRDVGAK